MPLRLSDLEYPLPAELIAQEPVEPRDAARLLVVRRAACECDDGRPAGPALEDRTVSDLPAILRRGDLLVRNDTRVLPARTFFRRPTGGRLELLFLRSVAEEAAAGQAAGGRGGEGQGDGRQWEVLIRGRPRVGETLTCASDATWAVRVEEQPGEGRWLVRSLAEAPIEMLLERHGEPPLPPYIRRPLRDGERYQTTFAVRPGSAAAPTAGLHFTSALDRRLTAAGVTILDLTLHVGLGTFRPLTQQTLEVGRLHEESFCVPMSVWQSVRGARDEGRRVVAVGTTVVRALEHLATAGERLPSGETRLTGTTGLFIAPGYRFQVVDALLTNFHLPRSSLLALVMAFAGRETARRAYAHAVAQRYRFFSFGDAMLIV